MKKLTTLLALLLVFALLAGCANAPQLKPSDPPDPEVPIESVPDAASAGELPTPPASSEDETSAAFIQPDGSYRFSRDLFPKMDGSTSLVPLAEAVASVLLGEPREDVQDLVQFNRTTQSFRNLMNGEADILIVGEPNAAVFTEMEEQGFVYDLEVIGNDALIFVVNADNPVDSLTTEQIRDIYSGKITNWKQVGGEDAEIIPFQRNENAGSQALLKKLIMGDVPLTEPPMEYVSSSMSGLMEAVRSYNNSANAIGYSVYYYANDMQMAAGLKILKIDGVAPSRETIRSGEYPHRSDNCCVIPHDAPANSPARVIYDWLMTEEGQRLVAAEGYVPVLDVN